MSKSILRSIHINVLASIFMLLQIYSQFCYGQTFDPAQVLRSELAPQLKAGHEPKAEVTIASGSLGEPRAVLRLIAGQGQWKTEAGTQFAKLELRFKDSVEMTRVEAKACDGSFAEGAEAYVNFDQRHVFAEGGKPTLVFDLSSQVPSFKVKTLVFNFRHNTAVCLASLQFYKAKTHIQFQIPEIIDVLAPTATSLFDARLQTVWSADETSGTVVVKFAGETRINSLRLWNGDQRSQSTFKEAPRVKTLSLSAENYTESLSVTDKDGFQVLPLKKAFKGKTLTLKVAEAYVGLANRASLTELQFGAGETFMTPDVSAALQANGDARRSAFLTADLQSVLDKTLGVVEDGDRWALRVRTDGSFFMRGFSDNLNEARAFTFLGTYLVKESTKRGLRIQVEGVRINPAQEMDSAVCGRECAGEPGPAGTRMVDEISFSKTKDGQIFVRDEGRSNAPGLNFRTLKARVSTAEE